MRIPLKMSLTMCLILFLLGSSAAFAAEANTESKEISLTEISKYQDKSARSNSNEIVITNPAAIQELATEQGFPDVGDIKKLTYTVGTVLPEASNVSGARGGTFWYQVGDVADQGTGYMLSDHFTENRYQGPMSGTKTFSREDYHSFNSTVGIGTDIISAKVGFTIGEKITVTDSVTLSVPSNQRIILKVWTNYQKKTFNIYTEYSNAVGLWYPAGSGNAHRAVGLIFTQAE